METYQGMMYRKEKGRIEKERRLEEGRRIVAQHWETARAIHAAGGDVEQALGNARRG